MAFGVIAAVAQRHGLPVVQASPQQVKKALCGRRDASKMDVKGALERRYSGLPWPPQQTLVEHAADALAAAVACLEHQVVRMARRMAASGSGRKT